MLPVDSCGVSPLASFCLPLIRARNCEAELSIFAADLTHGITTARRYLANAAAQPVHENASRTAATASRTPATSVAKSAAFLV